MPRHRSPGRFGSAGGGLAISGDAAALRGYVSVQRFYIYAERGLSRTRVSVWLYDGRLHMAHRDTLLARYAYSYDPAARRLRAVAHPELYRTLYTTQLELWELDDAQWRKITPRPYERHEPPVESGVQQLALPVIGLVAVLVGWCVRQCLGLTIDTARRGSYGRRIGDAGVNWQ